MDKLIDRHGRAVESFLLFHQGYTVINSRIDQAYVKKGHTLQEARILREIASLGECTAKDILSTVPINPSNLHRILSKLLQHKFIIVTRGKTDRRFKYVKITAAGANRATILQKTLREELVDILEQIDESKRDQLTSCLQDALVLLCLD